MRDNARLNALVRILAPGLSYFGLVFAIGFVLGVVRVLWLVPALGERTAELAEQPFMVLASYVVAGHVNAWFQMSSTRSAVFTGVLALALLLVIELTVVLSLRELTIEAYVAGRDPVSGTAYVLSLLFFAACPAIRFATSPSPS